MVEIKVASESVKSWKGDAVLVLMHEEDCKKCAVAGRYDGIAKTLVKRGDFDGKAGSLLRVPLFEGDVKNLYLAGLGKAEDDDGSAFRDALAAALRRVGRERNASVLALFESDDGDADMILGEAAGLCGYTFDKYKKKDEDKGFALREVFVPTLDAKAARMGRVFAAAQATARDLANEPGNVINPVTLAEYAVSFAKERGLACEVWDEQRLAKERMGALLAVGQGSATPPRLIHLTYTPKGKSKRKIVFVGKGLTFDSGGLDIKPAEFMKTMKGDKSGACNVLGIMQAVAELAPKAEVHGILAAAENMPSGSSFRPDDIIRARNGKTIEIDNTDAEGRLVLADALCLASELEPDVIIDMATLTGSCAVALGNWAVGLFTADEDLAKALLASSRRRGEPFWRLPVNDPKIGETLKSKFADLVNGASRYGGATFAAMFLAEFVGRDIPWAHIDIAGADFMKNESGIYSQGASAWTVRTCLDYVMGL